MGGLLLLPLLWWRGKGAREERAKSDTLSASLIKSLDGAAGKRSEKQWKVEEEVETWTQA